MPSNPPLHRALLLSAGTLTVLSLSALSGCSGEVKVQKIVYDAPLAVADEPTNTTQNESITDQGQPSQLTTIDSMDSMDSVDLAQPIPPLTTLAQAREALESIYDLDAELVAASMQEDPNRIHSLTMIAEFDRKHAGTLMTIIKNFGWPTREMVGLKAVQGAYIAVQHAEHDPEFQSNCLALIQQQVDQGQLPGAFLALMTDRVALSRGDPQIYGTQMTMAPDELGVMQAVPSAAIWQSQQLDQRRSALGMPPHARFIQAIELAYFESIEQAQSRVSTVPTD